MNRNLETLATVKRERERATLYVTCLDRLNHRYLANSIINSINIEDTKSMCF